MQLRCILLTFMNHFQHLLCVKSRNLKYAYKIFHFCTPDPLLVRPCKHTGYRQVTGHHILKTLELSSVSITELSPVSIIATELQF